MKKKIVKKSIMALMCFSIVAAGCVVSEKHFRDTAQIPEHDGEILVDSLNIQEEADTTDGDQDEKADTELVTSDDISEIEDSDSYFEEMRASINLDRNQVIAMLTDAEATAENSTEKENASQQKEQLLMNMQLEQEVESAIYAKGLPECLVLITENSVNVTVNKQELTDNEVAKICDIVMRQTDRNASQIIIQSKF